MSIIKIEEVYLYTTDADFNQAEMINSKAFMDNSGIEHTNLYYNDKEQLQEVLTSLNTWWTTPINTLPPATKFPLLTYVEVHDDIPARFSPVKYKQGLEEIQSFVDLYDSVMGNNA
jgi:hypothetical protein